MGDVVMATRGRELALHNVIAGLGGRPITRDSLEALLASATRGELDELTFLDLGHGVVARERGRMATVRRSGPSAENVLRDLQILASMKEHS